MKISVITRHAVANYGSLLQAIATQKIIEKTGNECEIIDYLRDDEKLGNCTFTLAKADSKWSKNKIIYVLYCIVRYPENYLANKKFERMQRQYLNLSKRYRSLEELKNSKPHADIYMTGSDQVWGKIMCGKYDSAYMLSFCNQLDKKVSYAASFGNITIDADYEKKMLSLLKQYSQITVRESNAVEILNEKGILAKQVLDPTLMLNSNEWRENLKIKKNEKKEKRYVLVYQIHNNSELCRYAKNFAKEVGLPLVRTSAMLHQFNKGGKFVALPDLKKFIELIDNAAWIVTDSFHGTAFAINFNIPFVTLMPNTGTKSRNLSILKLTQLEEQIVHNTDDYSKKDKVVDFSYANEILERERKKSYEILKKLFEV